MSSKGKFWPAAVCAHCCLIHQPSVLLIYVIFLMIPCFVLQSLALRIQNGRQAYLGADWVQLHTTLLPAF